MSLATLQREVARAVMTPLTPSERMRRKAPNGQSLVKVAARIIKPNDRLTSFERLEIYNRQYWFRVLDGFYEDFPGLRAVLGDRQFDAVAKAYLTDCPSRSFTMRDLGSRLESWLSRHPRYAGNRQQLALDMVRLEWAEIEAFDSAALPPITVDALSSGAGSDRGRSATSGFASGGRTFRARPERGQGPDNSGGNKKRVSAGEELAVRNAQRNPAKLRLKLQPYIRLLALRYPVDDLLLAIKHDTGTNVASNAMAERQKRRKVSAVARLKPVPTYLAVHRCDNLVYFRRLEREEFSILTALCRSKTLERAVEAGFRNSRTPIAQQVSDASAWFRNWAALGWFV
jgi:hypothetical protein